MECAVPQVLQCTVHQCFAVLPHLLVVSLLDQFWAAFCVAHLFHVDLPQQASTEAADVVQVRA